MDIQKAIDALKTFANSDPGNSWCYTACLKAVLSHTADLQQRAEAAEAQLAELAKRPPVGSFHIYDGRVDGTTDYVRDGEWPINDGELLVYARPVPPAPVIVKRPKLTKEDNFYTESERLIYESAINEFAEIVIKAGGEVADE